MTAKSTAAKPRTARAKRDTAPAAIVGTAPIAAEAERRTSPFGQIIPSSPQPVPLYQLRRATENVRHTRVDEDVIPLAEDIAAHGLLQSLIGYRDPDGCVHVVGGGRRFQALRHLENEGVIDGDWPVPVLIRDVDDAIELSLAENLQQRTMSPVDEFLAFRALMNRGDTSPAGLAKRFGFSERVVKQRLRLADLAEPILDALAGREITVDAAMAYAATQDQELQREVFDAETKRGKFNSNAHRPTDIRWTISRRGLSTEDGLYRFVGVESYELRGGGYEDDLFGEDRKDGRALANPGVLISAARDMLAFQMDRLLPELRERADLAPTIVGYLVADDLRVKSWGNTAPKAPAGFVAVEKYDATPMWKTIRNNGIKAHVLVGIDDKGELVVWPGIVFVPKGQKDVISPPMASHQSETPLERAIRERRQGVDLAAKRLAVGGFTGTPIEGRAFWPTGYYPQPDRKTIDGRSGWLVYVQVFVTDEQVAAQQAAAEAQYDREKAESDAAEQARTTRLDELSALTPPAVVVIDGEAWARDDDGSYAAIDEEGDGGYAGSWTALISNYSRSLDEIGDTFVTREDFDAAMVAAASGDEPDPGVNVAAREPAEVDA